MTVRTNAHEYDHNYNDLLTMCARLELKGFVESRSLLIQLNQFPLCLIFFLTR